jgi:predicted nucleic acid-binding protein
MSAEHFIDTSVFVYHLDAADPRKHAVAEQVVRTALTGRRGCISFQVVQECMNTVLRKADVPLDEAGARSYLDAVLVPLMQVPAAPDLYRRALDVRQRWRFSFYDSLIVAAALQAGCRRLLSEDLQHGQRIEGLVIENPFVGIGAE